MDRRDQKYSSVRSAYERAAERRKITDDEQSEKERESKKKHKEALKRQSDEERQREQHETEEQQKAQEKADAEEAQQRAIDGLEPTVDKETGVSEAYSAFVVLSPKEQLNWLKECTNQELRESIWEMLTKEQKMSIEEQMEGLE